MNFSWTLENWDVADYTAITSTRRMFLQIGPEGISEPAV
jgi:hypothetical protein